MTRGSHSATVLVMGLGNPLMEDDGFGCAVVDSLREIGLPPGVSAEIAPDVLQLSSLWRGQQAVWMVDAVARGGPPGTIHRFGHDAVLGLSAPGDSVHHLGFGDSLSWLLHATPDLRAVRFRLWGAEPLRVSPRQGLNQSVASAVVKVVREVLGDARRLATHRPTVATRLRVGDAT